MENGQKTHHRRSIRLPNYDYSQPGAYFVTIVAYQHICIFSKVIQGSVQLSEIGKIVKETWQELPIHFSNVRNEHFIIMPNHLHGIIFIEYQSVRATHESPLHASHCVNSQKTKTSSLGTIVGSFKSAASKRIHRIKGWENYQIWQRNYYEHVIRNEIELQRILEYIEINPLNWEHDPEYPIV